MTAAVLIPQHFGALLFDRHRARYVPFDDETSNILRVLVVRGAGAVLRSAHEDQRAPLQALVRDLAAQGLLDVDGRLDADVIDAVPPRAHLLGPLLVHVEVAGVCNLACRHCFAGPLPRAPGGLTTTELDALFAQMAARGALRASLSGGEPLARRDLLDVIDAAAAHGVRPSLTTNGLLLTPRLAHDLAARDLQWLNVSLDGACAATNDAIRGAGVFDDVLERLRGVRDLLPFSLAFTLTAPLVNEVEACVALAHDVGAQGAIFRPLYPVGVATTSMELMPTRAAFDGAVARIAALAAEGRPVACGVDAQTPVVADSAVRLFPDGACGAGATIASIGLHGAMSPCGYLGAAFDDDNVRMRPFADIWNNGRAFVAVRRTVDDEFAGGCRARAQALAGSAFRKDPWHAHPTTLRAPPPRARTTLARASLPVLP